MNIGPRIRAQRKALGFSQEALARKADVSLSLINQLEREIVKDPHWSTVSAVAAALGVSIADLTEESVPPKAPAPSSPPEVSEEGRRQREEDAEGIAHSLLVEVEGIVDGAKSSWGMELFTRRHLLELFYDEIGSNRQPSKSLQEVMKQLDAAFWKLGELWNLSAHPPNPETAEFYRRLRERRASIRRAEEAAEEAGQSARADEVG